MDYFLCLNQLGSLLDIFILSVISSEPWIGSRGCLDEVLRCTWPYRHDHLTVSLFMTILSVSLQSMCKNLRQLEKVAVDKPHCKRVDSL